MAACGVAAGLAFLGTSEDINQAFEAYILFRSISFDAIALGWESLTPSTCTPDMLQIED